MTSATIEPVHDPAKINHAFSLIEDVVDKPGNLKLDWITKQKWAAVPVEGAMHFNEKDAQLLSKAMKDMGHQECLAVATESLENTILCYQISTTVEGLLAFSKECGPFYFLLIPENRDFAVLCTADDFYIVAGSHQFVNQALGSSLDRARANFMEFATYMDWPESVREYFIFIAKKYESCNGL